MVRTAQLILGFIAWAMPVELKHGTRDHETNATEDDVNLIGLKL